MAFLRENVCVPAVGIQQKGVLRYPAGVCGARIVRHLSWVFPESGMAVFDTDFPGDHSPPWIAAVLIVSVCKYMCLFALYCLILYNFMHLVVKLDPGGVLSVLCDFLLFPSFYCRFFHRSPQKARLHVRM